jgi:protease-4
MNEEPNGKLPPAESESPDGPGSEPWQHDLINRLAFASLVEQRRSRRWSLVFKFSMLLYLVVVTIIYLPVSLFESPKSEKHTALVNVRGLISDQTDASADRVVTGLRAAFKHKNTAGVIVRINSPGGSPVQAGYINDEIRRLREKHPEIPLYAVISDICASGGYYIAAAADKIYANKSSVVGSIGVLMNGFGFVEAMNKLGVERRLMTAGESKGFLDPFSPQNPQEVSHLQTLLDQIHGQFIEVVKRGRGDRLKDDAKLFSGRVWTGEEGVALGLVDALGSSGYVAREVIGAEEIVDFTASRGFLERLANRFVSSLGGAIVNRFELESWRLR